MPDEPTPEQPTAEQPSADAPVGAAKVRSQIIINLMVGGAIQVLGPMNQPLIMYGMIELAKDAIRDYGKEKSQTRIDQSGMDPRALLGLLGKKS